MCIHTRFPWKYKKIGNKKKCHLNDIPRQARADKMPLPKQVHVD